MHGIIPYMFYYWADPVIHLLLLKGSIPKLFKILRSNQALASKHFRDG